MLPLHRNLLTALGTNALFYYFGLYSSPFLMFCFCFWALFILAFACTKTMKDDAGSKILSRGMLFGKKEFYPQPVINCAIDFANGAPTIESVIKAGKRLLQVKRLRCIFEKKPYLFDCKFTEVLTNLDDHLFIHVVERNDQWELINKLGVRELSTGKPLWELHYLHDGKFETAHILLRVSHGIGDGVRLSNVFFPIFFEDKDGGAIRIPKFTQRKKSGSGGGFFDFKAKWDWLKSGLDLVSDSATLVDSKTPIHTPKAWGTKKNYAFTKSKDPVDFGLVKKIKNQENVTVNDVMLTAMTQSMREYFLKRGQKFDEKFLCRCMCAIGIPTEDDSNLKNYFAVVAAECPVQCEDRKEVLRRVKKSMDTIKNSSAMAITTFLQDLTCYLGLDELTEKSFKDAFLNHTFIYSNVPGIQEQIYFAGKEVSNLSAFFPNTMMQMILFSYNNKVTVALTTDTKLVDAPEEIIDGFNTAIEAWAKDIDS